MIRLENAKIEHLSKFVTMENELGTKEYIVPYNHAKHLEEITKPNIFYLSILDSDELCGFIILATEKGESVEFRRIVVSSKNCGIGQEAIRLMELYCKSKLYCKRIWLDVFSSNHRGRHVYRKLGYKEFKISTIDSKKLLFFEKSI